MSPQIDVRDLRLVRAIFSQKTTAAAAKLLGMTQSGVSHQLRNLEDRLEMEVFERKGRGLVITEAGTKILTAGEEILRSLSELETDLRRSSDAPPQLKVAVECYTAYGWLPSATVEMKRRGMEVRILPVVPRTSIVEALLEDEADLALVIDASRDARFCQRRLFEDELVLVTSSHHPLSDKKFVTGDDLGEEHLFLVDSARANRKSVAQALFPDGGGFQTVTYLPLTEAILEMVRAGLGVSILARGSVQAHVEHGELTCIPLNRRGLRRRWVGAYRRDAKQAAVVRQLLGLLKEQGPNGVAAL